MARRAHAIAFTLVLSTALVTAAVLTVSAAGIPSDGRKSFDKAWHKRSAPRSVPIADRVYDETRSIQSRTMRVHRAADGYVLFAHPIDPQEETLLLKQGFRMEKNALAVRDRSIFNHEVYIGYMVGDGGPADDQLKRMQGTQVNAEFKAYRGVGSPMIVNVTPYRP